MHEMIHGEICKNMCILSNANYLFTFCTFYFFIKRVMWGVVVVPGEQTDTGPPRSSAHLSHWAPAHRQREAGRPNACYTLPVDTQDKRSGQCTWGGGAALQHSWFRNKLVSVWLKPSLSEKDQIGFPDFLQMHSILFFVGLNVSY